jgi:hypothetical protein
MSNYPPGMTSSDWDHVYGIARCPCGAELPERDAAGEPYEGDECPDGCVDPAEARLIAKGVDI